MKQSQPTAVNDIRHGGEADDRSLSELMDEIKEKSQTISAAVVELEKLLANIKEN